MSERCDVWDSRRVRACKAHTCDGCGHPICVGTVHNRIGCLFGGQWYTRRVHLECHELARDIGGDGDGYFVEDLRDQLRNVDDREWAVRAWRRLLRARIREQRGRTNLCRDAAPKACEGAWSPHEVCEGKWRAERCNPRMWAEWIGGRVVAVSP